MHQLHPQVFWLQTGVVSTLQGIPIVYDLAPANVDERVAAEAIIDHFSFCDIFSDKGFLA